MSVPTIDQDFALVRWLGVSKQLNCSVQLLDRIFDPAFAKQ
jgi:hypothetical protein